MFYIKRQANIWTKEEIKLLKENYSKMPCKELSGLLNRTEGAIKIMATKLFIKKEITKKCEVCGKEFVAKSKIARFCSKKCNKKYAATKYKNKRKSIINKHKEKDMLIKKELLESKNKFKEIKDKQNKTPLEFFLAECLNLDTIQGIKKLEQFTGIKSNEIYWELREEFIQSNKYM